MNWKNGLRTLHLWAGMITGSIVFVIALAAAVFVFQEELTDIIYRPLVLIEPQATPKLLLSDLIPSINRAIAPHVVESIVVRPEPDRPYIFRAFSPAKTKGWTFFTQVEYNESFYVNPYTGRLLGKIEQSRNPLEIARALHQQLLLTYDVGHYIVGGVTFTFFAMILSGLVMSAPQKLRHLKAVFKVRWNKRGFIRNYDSHRVAGLTLSLFILIIATTGLAWSFEWWEKGIYRLLGSDPALVFKGEDPPQKLPALAPEATAIDRVLADLVGKRPHWKVLFINLPDVSDEKSDHHISAWLSFKTGDLWDGGDGYAYNPQTGAAYHSFRQEDKTLGEKWRHTNYSIHVGQVFGFFNKLLYFFVALGVASLPVTGFLIWRHKRRRKIDHWKSAAKRLFLQPRTHYENKPS